MTRLRSVWAGVVIVLAAAVNVGCIGEVNGPGGATASAAVSPASMVPALIRRLNNTEYNNTVRDLLGDTTQPANGFPPDAAVGFDNISAVLTTSPLLVQGYFAAAQTLVPAALQNPIQGPRILTCTVGPSMTADACARQVLSQFGARAWRRPLTSTEVGALAALVASSMTAGDAFQDAVTVALEAILTSANFLYRPEIDPTNSTGTPHPLGDYELASRLSYFLWSSMPDDALLAAAAAGQLQNAAQLEAQARRMLADPKAAALLDSLSFEWLGTRSLELAHPAAPPVFPTFSPGLRTAMEAETRLVLQDFFDNEQNLLGLLSTDFTYVDATLAAQYGISGVTSPTPVRVSLAGTQRGGILTHGAYLTANSTPTRTSPTRRGKWVLAQLLCQPIPAPPPNVPALAAENLTGSLRQQLQEHATNPACSGCHGKMDPIGFSLEHFDGVGMWRDMDGTYAIDATGQLPDGKTFDGALNLQSVLQREPAVPQCITQQVWTYAMGRTTTSDDLSGLGAIAGNAQAKNFTLRELVVQVVLSDSFRKRITP